MKTFKGDFDYFLNKIKNDEKFSLSRWGDGELKILENSFIDLRFVKNGEFRYDPNIKEYKKLRDLFLKSYVEKDEDYYIGIACPCCVGQDKYEYMKKLSKQNEKNLTWANIFVNSNYNYFLNNMLPIFKEKKIVMVVNKQANVNLLPFTSYKTYKIGTDAWLNDFNIIETIKNDFKDKSNFIFLFAAGTLSNILTYELWFNMNKNNTYIDIGSTLDVKMGMKPTRGYLNGSETLNKKCIW